MTDVDTNRILRKIDAITAAVDEINQKLNDSLGNAGVARKEKPFLGDHELQEQAISLAACFMRNVLNKPELTLKIWEELGPESMDSITKQSSRKQNNITGEETRSQDETRVRISTKEAARIAGYHPRYFSRAASRLGLTKIRMSSCSCRYYLDEVEALAEQRSIPAKNEWSD